MALVRGEMGYTENDAMENEVLQENGSTGGHTLFSGLFVSRMRLSNSLALMKEGGGKQT